MMPGVLQAVLERTEEGRTRTRSDERKVVDLPRMQRTERRLHLGDGARPAEERTERSSCWSARGKAAL